MENARLDFGTTNYYGNCTIFNGEIVDAYLVQAEPYKVLVNDQFGNGYDYAVVARFARRFGTARPLTADEVADWEEVYSEASDWADVEEFYSEA